jgi:ribonuclease HI
MVHYEIWTDGSTIKSGRSGEGESGIGYVIMDVDTQKIVHLHGEYCGRTTNNRAEMLAVEYALQDVLLREEGEAINVDIVSDSKMVVESLVGNYNLTVEALIEMVKRIKKLEKQLQGEVRYYWVRGHSGEELNEKADWLAYTAARG